MMNIENIEKKRKSWLEKLTTRDKRALIILILMAPTILFWWGITRPLLDEREALLRARERLGIQNRELQPLLRRALNIRDTIRDAEFTASATVLSAVESLFAKIPAGLQRPTIHRKELLFADKRQPIAEIRFADFDPAPLWKIFELVASSDLKLANLDLAINPGGYSISGNLSVWLK